LAAYVGLLAKWNTKINLTSLKLDPADQGTLDRLIIEPLVAARRVLPSARFAIDIGSGGGSPALPMKLALPSLRFVLVESKVRKAAFLSEAVRQLALGEVEIANRRFEELTTRADLHEAADLVTVRAVKVDRGLWDGILRVLKPQGQVMLFVGADQQAIGSIAPPFRLEAIEPVPSFLSQVAIVTRSA
jgi:16S rRNA (guanine527-N7)-methyltransferase